MSTDHEQTSDRADGAPDAKKPCTDAADSSACWLANFAEYVRLVENGLFDKAGEMYGNFANAHMVLSHLPESADLQAAAEFVSEHASGIKKMEAFAEFAGKNKKRPLKNLMVIFDALQMDTQSLVSADGLAHLMELGNESIVTACIFHRHAIFRQALPSDFARACFVRIFDLLDYLATRTL
ncbi:MAG: hypothetical protein EBZ75_13790 [Oxalobacteraceae bacterium]|nr:hypothetical protein [Oxalobacteraceae bacterium]